MEPTYVSSSYGAMVQWCNGPAFLCNSIILAILIIVIVVFALIIAILSYLIFSVLSYLVYLILCNLNSSHPYVIASYVISSYLILCSKVVLSNVT